MKHFLSLIFCALALAGTAQVSVTFRVNMSNQTVGPNGVHVAGNFQGWNPSGTPLTNEGDGVYSVTVSVAPGTYLYKFINGNDWPAQENGFSACGIHDGFGGFNREVVVSGSDLIMEPVCFGQCVNCVQPVSVTLRVVLDNQIPSANGVHVAGNFQGWNPGGTPMQALGNGLYSHTFNATPGEVLQYRFINGNDWPQSEAVPGACGVPDGFGGFNRTYTVGNSDMVLDGVCFGTCNACDVVVDPVLVNVLFKVNMQNEVVSADGVHIAGNFQGFDPASTPMTDADGDGIYEYETQIEENTQVLFKFINGNMWSAQESVPGLCGLSDGFGNNNRVLYTTAADEVYGPVCFGECINCGEVVEEPTNTITLKVNMQQQVISQDGVHVAGNFQGWDPAATPMTDVDGDGIFEYTFQAAEWANLSFKFINGNSFSAAEVVPSSCGLPDGFGGTNRILETGTLDINYGPVCFGSCIDCDPIVDPALVDVTFRVNMSDEEVGANTISMVGSPFGTVVMTAVGNGVYEYTGSFMAGSTVTYAFVNGAQQEVVPVACGVDAGNGTVLRSLLVAPSATITSTVCFGSCQNCPGALPATVTVVFQVDMSNVIVGSQGVRVAGNFQGWNPNGTPMNSLGSGIYELAYQVDANQQLQFKFINGNDWPQQEVVPAACGVSDGFGGTNRTLTVGTENVVFGPVCFSQCAACDNSQSQTVQVTFQVDMSNVTVSGAGVHIAGNFQGWNPSTTQMTALGNGIYQHVAQVPVNTEVLFKFINGNDWPGQETAFSACGVPDGFGGFNRTLSVATSNITFGPVCFGQCNACLPSVPVLITFRVDMSNQIVSSQGVYIAGNFNNWDPTATQMSQYAPGLYQAVVVMNSGETTGYKFLNGPAWTGTEVVPAECGVNDGTGIINRVYTAGAGNETLSPVCFNECGACTVIAMVSVTFQVDMSQQTVEPSGVWLAGSFNNFNPVATPMSNNGFNVYTATVMLLQNTQHTFKYLNGSTWEAVPFACGFEDGFGGFNRLVNVASTSFTLPEVCFSDCIDCPISVDELGANNFWTIYPNPANDLLNVRLSDVAPMDVRIYDMRGALVVSRYFGTGQFAQVPTGELAQGMYQVVLQGIGAKTIAVEK